VITVCEICRRACCWQGVDQCVGAKSGRRQSMTLTADEATEMAFEHSSFWQPPRAADQAPRDLDELLDVVKYSSTRPCASRRQTRARLVEDFGIDADQVDAALEQAWPVRRAS
jgi:hypothetical protein